jgi:hypothetical protein
MHKSLWLSLGIAITGCYLGPEKHRADETTPADAGQLEFDAATEAASQNDVNAPSQEAGSGVDSGWVLPVDAGCVSNLACPASAPACVNGDCVACRQHGDCTSFPGTPACGPTGACVTCTADQKAVCAAPTPACDSAKNSCVECVTGSDCTTQERAACSAEHTCAPCKADTECARFGKVCETSSGVCVQCRPTTEEADCRTDKTCEPGAADCAGTACDPKRNVCTTTLRGSLQVCAPCVSDTECASGHHCVPLSFGVEASTKALGGFCMKLNAQGCEEPFRAPAIEGRTSLSGRTAQSYCGIDETLTSCPAITALQEDRDCTDGMATSCNAPGALCKTVNSGANKCTYSCLSNRDCIRGAPCRGPAGETYCGG